MEASLSGHIEMVGAIYNEDEIAKILMKAKFFIHPGAVGLSILHALSYNIPVITHNDGNNHMPEFCVLEDGVNSLLYDNKQGLLSTVKSALSLPRADYQQLAKNCSDVPEYSHNTRVMAERFIQAMK
ncbi:glycosyltransferase [Endozoicomonas atrinae]|uniref:glycosyltransferase n=1 Tax=Endozoicomonas atrinae TaxID=1333660 RepID=UPI000826E3BF|nr:glycosyltransferase [Endozoicomonas atrinae]